jgi:hypothetical protein
VMAIIGPICCILFPCVKVSTIQSSRRSFFIQSEFWRTNS